MNDLFMMRDTGNEPNVQQIKPNGTYLQCLKTDLEEI